MKIRRRARRHPTNYRTISPMLARLRLDPAVRRVASTRQHCPYPLPQKKRELCPQSSSSMQSAAKARVKHAAGDKQESGDSRVDLSIGTCNPLVRPNTQERATEGSTPAAHAASIRRSKASKSLRMRKTDWREIMKSCAFVPSFHRMGRVCDTEPPVAMYGSDNPTPRAGMRRVERAVKRASLMGGREMSYVCYRSRCTTCDFNHSSSVWAGYR